MWEGNIQALLSFCGPATKKRGAASTPMAIKRFVKWLNTSGPKWNRGKWNGFDWLRCWGGLSLQSQQGVTPFSHPSKLIRWRSGREGYVRDLDDCQTPLESHKPVLDWLTKYETRSGQITFGVPIGPSYAFPNFAVLVFLHLLSPPAKTACCHQTELICQWPLCSPEPDRRDLGCLECSFFGADFN